MFGSVQRTSCCCALFLGVAALSTIAPLRLPGEMTDGSSAISAATDPKTAAEVLEEFRREWSAQRGHMRTMDDRGWKARMVALCELVKISKEAISVLTEALEDKDAEMRAFAAQALGFLADGPAEKMDAILNQDSDPISRLYAADALGMFGGMKPTELYERVEKQDANKDVRAHVRFALQRNGERLKDFEDAGAQLLVIDPHESYRVRHMLKEAGFKPDDLHVPVLADPAHTISATYGVAFQMKIHTEWSNRPATFIIDRAGTIRYERRAKTYSDRPAPKELLKELAKLATE